MGDDEDCRGLAQLGQGGLDVGLVLGIERRGGLVEQQDRGAFQQGASHRNPLPFTARQTTTTLTDAGIPSTGQASCDLVDPGQGSCLPDLLVSGIRVTDANVLRQGGVVEVDVLEDHGELTHELLGRLVAHVQSADTHRPQVDVPEPRHEPEQGRLASPRGADNGRQSPSGSSKGDVMDDGMILVVAKGDVLEGHLPGSGELDRVRRLG